MDALPRTLFVFSIFLLCGVRLSFPQTVTTTTNYSVSTVVRDGDPSGLVSVKTLSTPIVSLTDLNVRLRFTGSCNGDLYCYLAHSSGFSVLLNRVGRRAGQRFGYADSGMDVTFDDEAIAGDVHNHRLTLKGSHTIPISGPLTNRWSPDGRTASPSNVLNSDSRPALLSSFDGLDPNGDWVLFVADLEAGSLHTLVSWGLEATGFTPPLITRQPTSRTIGCASGNVTFSVEAGGSAPLRYQWRFRGLALANATNSSLIVGSSPADAGNYELVITNNHGSVTSVVATLTIVEPVVTWNNPISIPYGTPLGPTHLKATANLPGTFTYTPPAGTVLNAGNGQMLSVTFTPDGQAGCLIAQYAAFIDVTKAPLAISADNKSKTYGSANPALTVSYSGFVNGDSKISLDTPAILTTTATAVSPVGSYGITVRGAADANYTITFRPGTLVVTKAPLLTETVAWQNVGGASAGSGVLTKTEEVGWSNAGACSTRGIAASSDGYAEFTVPADGGYVFFGLSNGDTGLSFADIDYAFYPYPGRGLVVIYEKGVYIGSFGAFAPGNKLTISVEANAVRYWRDGVLLHTSALAPTYPLRVDTSLYSIGATIEAVTLAGTKLVSVVTETVAWQNVGGASVGSGVLTKTAEVGWSNAGACSTRGIAASGDGYAEFTVPADGGYVFFGLSNGDTGQSFADIDYAFYPYPGRGLVVIYEKGVYIGSFGAFAPGNKLTISVEANAVRYWRDGVLLHTSALAPTYPLRVDTSLYSIGATIEAVTLAGTGLVSVVTPFPTQTVTWQNVRGASVWSGVLTKTAEVGWGNAGACSTHGIAAGSDGYAEFTVPADGGYVFLGLTHGDIGQGYTEIDYAFYPHPGQGLVVIYEKGVYLGSFGAVAPGNKLAISVEADVVRYWRDDVVRYWRDGVLLYTSTSAPAYPLRVDTSLYTPGATILPVTLAGTKLVSVAPAFVTETVAWQNLAEVSVESGVLTKTAKVGWGNAGACSTRGIAAGSDGYAEFTVPADGGYVFFGLGNGDTGQGYTEIDYAFYPHPGLRLVVIYEKGEYIGSFGAVAPGNKLAISVEADVVRYWRDGMLLYTSMSSPTYPLRVDTSLYTTGAMVPAVTLAAGTLIDTP